MKYIININVLVLSIALLPMLGYGQNSLQTTKPQEIDVQVDYGFGFLKNEHSSLNTVLQNNGWAKVNDGMLAYSAAVKVMRNRFLFGVQWMVFNSSVKKAGVLQTNLGCFSIEPFVGYSIIRTNKYRLSPSIGFNVSYSNLNLKDLTPVNNFSSVIAASRKETTIEFSNYVLDFGMQGERIFNLKNSRLDCPQTSRYLVVGLKAGYFLNLSETHNGSYNNQRFADSPTFHLNGFYGTLMIGGGKRFRQLK